MLDLDASSGTGFFGVFDGHGGKEVSRYAALHLVPPHTPPRLCCWLLFSHYTLLRHAGG